jgi:hypothetical protein
MTRLSWHRHLSKKSITTLLLIIALAIVFFYRQPIAIKSIQHFTKPHGLYITCLDFSLSWRLELNLKQACITSVMATILIRDAIWQPWSNTLSIAQIKIRQLEPLEQLEQLEQLSTDSNDTTDNQVDDKSFTKQQKNGFDLPDSLPKLHVSSLEIDSHALLQPLQLSVETVSSNGLNISGDLHAFIKISQNMLSGHVTWRLADLTKWTPQAQRLFQDNSQLLKTLAFDKSPIKTSFSFDGEWLKVSNNFDIISYIAVSNCPIDVTIKGDVSVDFNVSDFNASLDLSQLSSDVSLVNCLLLQDYFVKDERPQLAFIIEHEVTINESQIALPKLQIIDQQHAHRSVVFTDVKYQTAGEFEVNYNVSLKQPIQAKRIAAKMFDFQAQGTLLADLSSLPSELATSLKIINGDNRLVINSFKMDSLFIGDLNSQFSLRSANNEQLQLKGTLNSSAIQMGVMTLAKINSAFAILGPNLDELQLSIDNQFFQLHNPDIAAMKVRKISNHVDLSIKKLETLSFSGDSTIKNSSVQNIDLLSINITHTGQASLANMSLSSQHKMVLERGFMVDVEQQQNSIKVQIEQQNIVSLQRIISQFENTLILKEGDFSVDIELALPQKGESLSAKGKINLQNVSVKYQDYVLKNMAYQTPLIFDSAGLQLAKSTLHLDSIDVGVMIEKISSDVVVQNNVLRLQQVQGEIFNGQFLLGDLWLDEREQQFTINIQDIDLAQIVALQQQPEIRITGNVDGDMPFIMGKQGLRMEDGFVSSLAGGKLTIINSPSFDSIKEQQPELALLENIDFTQLKSNVKFTPDGWVFFDLALQGINPDKKQSINFNYSHQENIFSLLESIRLVKSVENKIEQKVEQKITQGNKK